MLTSIGCKCSPVLLDQASVDGNLRELINPLFLKQIQHAPAEVRFRLSVVVGRVLRQDDTTPRTVNRTATGGSVRRLQDVLANGLRREDRLDRVPRGHNASIRLRAAVRRRT